MGVLNGGGIVGADSIPFMQLEYGCRIKVPITTYTGVGSRTPGFTLLDGVFPCDVSPMSDQLVFAQLGQQSTLTHIIHFQPGTPIADRSEIVIVYAPQPGNYGNVGDTYLITEVLEPSQDLSYIRCRALKGKVPNG